MRNAKRRTSVTLTAGAISAAILSTLFSGPAAQTATPSQIPVPTQVQAPVRVPASGVYVVRRGDTLSGIAARHGISLRTILAINRMNMRTIIYPGQRIRIGTAARSAIHIVRRGDTLSGIAARYGISLRTILAINRMNMRTIIYPGQRIIISGSGQAWAPATNPSVGQLKSMVANTARRMGVSPSLALAIALQESSFRQNVTSWAGAIGTMQVMPSSGVWASQLVGRPLNLRNAQDNITAGVAIIRALIWTSPNLRIAIASYYQGQRSVMTRGMFRDTRAYVASVLSHERRFR
ncbi:lytic transglycosylase [Arthrobacter sp. ZGTC412]|uniref:lytic transglycosylase n=1 Tax=Arthrobacter sp. ZGTC412 TaxID=2058900 RepID=UPI000CE38D15|nr:LysM peptidoglycan-binding domain-containing protein [Arthrobacter sp. ZGTC412]